MERICPQPEPNLSTPQYSGNSGVSWVYQVAPTIPGAFYELNQVAVLKGTVAFAVGGNPFGTDGTPSLNTNERQISCSEVSPKTVSPALHKPFFISSNISFSKSNNSNSSPRSDRRRWQR